MDFLELAKRRYSERRFDPRPVEQEKLDRILEAGRVVPTAHNNQPQRIYVLRSPEALETLPAPTHVFIGGSGGEIGAVLDQVFKKNPEAKIVVNCITSETLLALHTALKRFPVRDLQCVQVSVNREEQLGNYHFLRAGNPVFIISFAGQNVSEG